MLDVGCGSGGRVFRLLADHGFEITGIDANLRLLMDLDCNIRHVELDQYPQLHAYIIAQAGVGLERVG